MKGKKIIIIFIAFVVLLACIGIYYIARNKNVSKLNEVDFITSERIVNYHDKIFSFCGLGSSCVTEGLYDSTNKYLFLKYEDDGNSSTFKGRDEKVIYVSVKNGTVNTKETEINDFSKYKGNSNYIYFTGEEYIEFLHKQGLNW